MGDKKGKERKRIRGERRMKCEKREGNGGMMGWGGWLKVHVFF